MRPTIALLLAACAVAGCTREGRETPRSPRYLPRMRDVTITTVPLLVKEQRGVLPFLEEDFAKGGVLEGKEVYAFSPSTITVVEGDTVRFTLVNPEDDVHNFVLPDLAVPLPPQRTTRANYVARRPGIYLFVCTVPAHMPMMWGQLVVLSAASMAGAEPPRPPAR